MKMETRLGNRVSLRREFQTSQDFPGHPIARLHSTMGGHLKVHSFLLLGWHPKVDIFKIRMRRP